MNFSYTYWTVLLTSDATPQPVTGPFVFWKNGTITFLFIFLRYFRVHPIVLPLAQKRVPISVIFPNPEHLLCCLFAPECPRPLGADFQSLGSTLPHNLLVQAKNIIGFNPMCSLTNLERFLCVIPFKILTCGDWDHSVTNVSHYNFRIQGWGHDETPRILFMPLVDLQWHQFSHTIVATAMGFLWHFMLPKLVPPFFVSFALTALITDERRHLVFCFFSQTQEALGKVKNHMQSTTLFFFLFCWWVDVPEPQTQKFALSLSRFIGILCARNGEPYWLPPHA